MKQPSIEQKVAFLRRVPLFRGIDDKLLGVLAGIMALERRPAGNELCKQGGPGDACFIVGHGQVEVVARDGEGERLLSTLGPGQTVGEVALVDGKKRSATVRCKTDASIFFLRRADFDQLLLAGNPASQRLLDNIAQTLAQRVRVVNERFGEIFSRAGDTISELGRRLEALQASLEVEEGEGQEDLLALVGYSGDKVPSSR